MEKQAILKELYTAVAESNLFAIKSILEINPELLHVETPNGSWLHVAARRKDIEIIDFFVKSGLNINKEGGFAKSMPIDLAVSEGNIEAVEYFLRNCAIFDESAPERNPLFAAIHKGHLNILKLLVKYGINTNIKYGDKTPLTFARQMGNEEIVRYLTDIEK
jgi:ankyrin repeat protein